jgi:predicted nucleic-acid-binding protein
LPRLGVDTNVLLRWLVAGLGDDDQARKAAEAVEGAAEIHVNLVVLAEVIWMARQSAGLDRNGQAALVRGLLDNPRVSLAERPAVSAALDAFELGGAGFVDHLIAVLNRGSGCATTLTFDKVAARSAEFTLLS